MERKPIQLKTKTKLTAQLYCTNVPGSKQSSRVSNTRASATNKSALGLQPQSLQHDSRPNTSDSNSFSWVIIENVPSCASSVALDSHPASQLQSRNGEPVQASPRVQSPLNQGSRAQSATALSRSPTPAAMQQPPSVLSDEVSIPQPQSPTGSQQTTSRPQSRMGCGSQAQSPLGSTPPSTVLHNKLQTYDEADAKLSQSIAQLEQN